MERRFRISNMIILGLSEREKNWIRTIIRQIKEDNFLELKKTEYAD